LISSTVSRLSELSGLEGAKNALMRLVRPDSAVHAVLLYGAQGAGKESLAEALAQAWMCTAPTPEGACGVCRVCEAFARDRSADFLRIVPKGPSDWIKSEAITPKPKTPDGEDIVSLIEFFRTRPLSGRHKVAAVYRADRLYPDASNAFLKTLEEPHPHAKIVMTTSEIGRVLPTIVSRCVAVACELPSSGELLLSSPPAALLAFAEGAPGRLKHVLDHAGAYEKISAFALKLTKAQPGEALALAEQFRIICDSLQDALGCNGRMAGVEGLRALGSAVAAISYRESWLLEIAEAHRRILGNGNEGSVLDAMFASMLIGV
jgi:hypothetical protein